MDISRMSGDVLWYEGCTLLLNDEEFVCCALVSCSKSDCDESNSKESAGSLTAMVVASWPIFSRFRSRSRASRKSLSCGTLYQ